MCVCVFFVVFVLCNCAPFSRLQWRHTNTHTNHVNHVSDGIKSVVFGWAIWRRRPLPVALGLSAFTGAGTMHSIHIISDAYMTVYRFTTSKWTGKLSFHINQSDIPGRAFSFNKHVILQMDSHKLHTHTHTKNTCTLPHPLTIRSSFVLCAFKHTHYKP